MISKYFIDRPIFASVLSIVLTIAGGIALFELPVAQYPEITPPTVNVSAFYPGANARVVADTVAAPIEQQVNGVENMLYMSSQSNNDGSYNLTVTFDVGTDLNMAQVLVQNRVAIALPQLPEAVRQIGVTTLKRSPSILLVINMVSPDGRYDQLYLSNYTLTQLRDAMARVEGVGDVFIFGQQDFSMRLWLDPEKLAARNLSASDVIAALREQNVQVAAGAIGQPPVPPGQQFQYTVTTLGRLETPEQFGNIVLKTGEAGEITYVRDVATVELGAKSVDQISELNGMPNAGMAIFQLPGSNALDTARRVRAKMEELRQNFPEGIDYRIVYDTTPFIAESVRQVEHALRDAIILVAIVVLVFLQNWRSTIIPLVAVPVSLIGTLAVMYVMGFTLNNLTLFGIVLAVGIVVDDAIVVVENVERWLEAGLSAREAAFRSMEEVTVAVIAIAFGLSAVFIPTAFISGITGQFYRQFALTIAVSTLISAFNSLTLSPALAAILLKPHSAKPDLFERLIDATLGWFFRGFNRFFEWFTHGYTRAVRWCVRGWPVSLAVYFALVYATHYGITHLPTGFIPNQDKGYLFANIQLPDAASLERTHAVVKKIRDIVMSTEGVAHNIAITGRSIMLNATGSNLATMFIILDKFENRHDPELYADAIAAKLRARLFAEVQDAIVAVFGAPPVDGLGATGGLKMMVQDRADNGLVMLQNQTEELAARAMQQPGFVTAFTQFRANTPQLYLDIDRVKAKTMGVLLSDVFAALQVYLGGFYVNDFNLFGRTWQVNLQADARFRDAPEKILELKVRNAKGDMVPLGSIARIVDTAGPISITRYNMFPAAALNVMTAPGMSSARSIEVMKALADEQLPQGMGFEWTELTYMQIRAGNTAILILPLCVLFVFLTHSAEYESWMLPLGIILIVPLSILFALIGLWYRGIDNNLFAQIGFVVLIGLAAKNAVLIIEFAKQKEEQGLNSFDAAIEASRLRLRPILMTSFAFILGVVPLMLAKGAGAEMRRTLGTAVFSGMLGVTFFGIFLTPVFYYVLRRISRRPLGGPHTHAHLHTPMPHGPAGHAPVTHGHGPAPHPDAQ